MKRKWIYYGLTALAGGVYIGSILNTQLIIVGKNTSWSSRFSWELILVGWGALVYAIGCLSLSHLSDKFGRLSCITGSLISLAILNALMGWKILGPYQLWHFFLYWALLNIAFGIFFTGIEGLFSEYQDHSVPLARRLGMYCIAWAVGDMIAAFATGYTKQALGAETIYQALAILCTAASIITIWDLILHGYKKLGEHDIGADDIRAETPFYATLGRIGLFFACVANQSLGAAFPRFGRDFHHLTEGEIGNVLAIFLLAIMCTFIWMPLWRGWHYKRTLQILMQTPLIAGLLLIALAPSRSMPFLILGFALFGMGYGMTYFFSIYYTLMVHKDHGKSGGLHEAVLGLGNLFGPLIAFGGMEIISKTSLLPIVRIGVTATLVGLAAIVLSLSLQIILMRLNKISHND